jgi:hypothetical protein
VLKPHLATVYERHLAVANPVYEPPTRRILARCSTRSGGTPLPGPVLGGSTRRSGAGSAGQAWERRLLDALTTPAAVTGDVEAPLIVPPAHAAIRPGGAGPRGAPAAFDPHARRGSRRRR